MISWKKTIGIVLIAVSVLCIVLVVLGIYNNIAHSGPVAGKIVSYVPPFYGHGLVIIGLGVAGVICLLAGVVLIGTADK